MNTRLSQTQNSMERSLSRYSRLDFFKFDGQLRHAHGPVSSGVGVFGTFFLVLVMLTYVIFTFVRWWTEPPTQSSTEFLMDKSVRAQMIPFCFSIPMLSDPSYFVFTMYINQLDTAGSKVGNSTYLSYTFQDLNTVCLAENETRAQLWSFCNPGECSIIKLRLFPCGTGDPQAPDYGQSNATCASREEIANVLQTRFFSLQFKTFLGDIRINTAPKMELSLAYAVSMRLNVVETAPDLFRSFAKTEETKVAVGTSTSSIQYFFGNTYPQHEVILLEMELDPLVIKSENTRLTIVDVVGTWGALFGVVGPVFALYFLRYNEKKFYRANPRWKKINSACLIDDTIVDETNGGQESNVLITCETDVLLPPLTRKDSTYSEDARPRPKQVVGSSK